MTDPEADPITTSAELHEGINALRDQTRHADSKAQMLAAALIPSLVGAVAVGGFARLPAAAVACAVPAAVFALAAIVALGIVIWPQTDTSAGPQGITATLAAARRRSSEPDWRETCLAAEHSHLTRIVAGKWRSLAVAIVCAAAALGLGAITVALTALA